MKKTVKICCVLALIILIFVCTIALAGCNPAFTEGTVVDKTYGILKADLGKGMSFNFGNRENYYIKVSNGKTTQWFNVLDEDTFNSTSVGDHFVYDADHYRAVSQKFGK